MSATPAEDTVEQEAALRLARSDLQIGLVVLAGAARRASQAGTKRPVNLDEVYGAVAAVRRLEEACDLAALDLATAQGEDA